MSIHDAFNDIAVEQGGIASTDGTIIGAIDALTDALAGEDAERAKSIEGAIRLLGEHIGSAASSGTYTFSIWNVDSTGTMATDGDYATARASLTNAKPIVCVICGWNFDQDYPLFDSPKMLSVELDQTNIKLWLSSTNGYSWSENGVEYFEL
jgi:hypothetical protein